MMTDTRAFDVLTVDGIDMDLVVTVDELPGQDLKVMGQLVGNLPGGPAANFACAASRLGLRVAALAEVGEDQPGQAIIDDFNSYGVDTSLIQVRPDGKTCFTIILVPRNGEKAIIIVPTFQSAYDTKLMESALSRARLMYLMPSNIEKFLTLAQVAHASGVQVMIDVEPTVGSKHTIMNQILKHTDIASFNQFGFTAATGL